MEEKFEIPLEVASVVSCASAGVPSMRTKATPWALMDTLTLKVPPTGKESGSLVTMSEIAPPEK